MKLFMLVMLSIIRIIAIFGETTILRLDKDLPGGGSEIQMLNTTSQDTEIIESIIGSGGKRSKRSCCGGDGGFGSVKFSESSNPREDVISTEKVETTNGSEQRPAPYTIIGGDRSSGSDQFSNRTDAKMDKLYLFSKIPSINDILR